MRHLDGDILLSATDLMRFMGCAHATTLDLGRLRGEGPEPGETTEGALLLQKQGDAHEAGHLQKLKSAGTSVIEIPRSDLAADAQATRAALAQGAEVVFQGAFLSGNWGGWSDFLQRVDRPSHLGPFSYEVADTKLKRSVQPKHVLQLVLYSDLLAKVQVVAPEFAHVELGSGERATLRLADFQHYARAARARLEAFVADPRPTRPVPCADCGLCRWAGHCEGVWQAEDSLFNIANVTRGQVKKLEAAGVSTMAALAALTEPVRGMAAGTQARLVTQARLQHGRKSGVRLHRCARIISGRTGSLKRKRSRWHVNHSSQLPVAVEWLPPTPRPVHSQAFHSPSGEMDQPHPLAPEGWPPFPQPLNLNLTPPFTPVPKLAPLHPILPPHTRTRRPASVRISSAICGSGTSRSTAPSS